MIVVFDCGMGSLHATLHKLSRLVIDAIVSCPRKDDDVCRAVQAAELGAGEVVSFRASSANCQR